MTDVGYDDQLGTALAAAVVFESWDSPTAARTYTTRINGIAEYMPGSFYKRELPCLRELLDSIDVPIEAIIVDGHSWLSRDRPGLGHHLYEALGRTTPVIGVAKKHFRDGIAVEVLRGQSRKPLYVTEDGYGLPAACEGLRSMHGPHRIPTLFKLVDGLSRGRGR